MDITHKHVAVNNISDLQGELDASARADFALVAVTYDQNHEAWDLFFRRVTYVHGEPMRRDYL